MDANATETVSQAGGQISRDEALAWLRSDFFRQALDEPGESLAERAELLSVLGRRSFTDFQSRRNVESLDDAIRFAREALDELPAGQEAVTEYADTLVFYAQTKCIAVEDPKSTEEYISAIQAAVDATQAGSAHNHFVQRLAWAYWARFELSKSDDDLDNVIAYVNGLIDAHQDIEPQTELVLGGAYHSRFLRTKATEDIEKALDLHEKALKSPEAGRPVRHIFLQKLVQYSVDKFHHTCEEPDLNRLISNAKFAIPELPQSDTKERFEEILSRAETYRDLLQQGPLLDFIFKELGDLKLDDKNGPKPIGNTYVPKALYDKFPMGQKDIRTLELMPGKPDEEIVCKLHTVSLAGDVEYEVCRNSRPLKTNAP